MNITFCFFFLSHFATVTTSVLGKTVRFVFCACIQILDLFKKTWEDRCINLPVIWIMTNMPLYFCSLCFLWLSCLHLPGLLGDPVFAVVALSQRIVLLCVLAFAYRIIILSGISVSTEVSKDDTCWLTVAAACTAAALCLRLASKPEQHFSLHLVFIFFPDTVAAKAGFGRHASRKHRLVSWWLWERSDKEAGLRAGARNASPALLSPACARARSCPLVFSCCWGCRAGGVQPSVLHGAASCSICCVVCRLPWLPLLISAPHC